MAYFTTTIFHPETARVRKVWDKEDILDPNASLSLSVDVVNGGSLFVHGNRAELAVIYKALDDYFSEVHEAQRAEREAEEYASYMLDKMVEA